MLEKQNRAVRVTGYIQKEKLLIWKNVKKELEMKNGQKLNDSFILNYLLGQLGEIDTPGTPIDNPIVKNRIQKK